MRIPALIAIAALTCGTAFAQGYGSSSSTQRDAAHGSSQSTAAAPENPSGSADDGLVAKTKRAFHRLGEKMRSMGNKDHDTTASKSDTRSMGAPGSGTADSARQSRMDQAYANSKSKSQDK